MSLTLKIKLFDSTRGAKKQYGFLVSSGSLLSRKVWWGFQFVSFCIKFRYFEHQNGQNGGPCENKVWLYSNSKMNVTSSSNKKVRWKKWAICLVFIFSSYVMVYKLSKISIIYTFFKEMECFIGTWANVHETRKAKHQKISDAAEIWQNSSIPKANIFETLIQSTISNTIYWKSVMRTFRCYI